MVGMVALRPYNACGAGTLWRGQRLDGPAQPTPHASLGVGVLAARELPHRLALLVSLHFFITPLFLTLLRCIALPLNPLRALS